MRILALILAMAIPAFGQIGGGCFGASCGGGSGVGGASGSLSAASATYTTSAAYFPPGGSVAANASETAVQGSVSVAGTLSNLSVKLGTAPGAGNSLAFTFRKNAADTTLTCTISGTTTPATCSDLTHNVSVAAGDLIDIKVVGTGTPAATTAVILWATPGQAGPAGATGATGPAGATGPSGPTGPGYAATSTTSLAVGTGSLSFTTQSGLAYSPGVRARASSAANTANYVEGIVTSYSGTTLVVNVDTTGGSGSHADWNLNASGNVGVAGATGPTGATGAAGPAGPAPSGTGYVHVTGGSLDAASDAIPPVKVSGTIVSGTGGASRTQQAHNSDMFDIRDYGAVGDGSTDDSGAVQKAINAASAAGGGTVFCPGGNYAMGTANASAHPWFFYNVLVPSNVTIEGANGCTFTQTSAGRAALPGGASYVANSVFAIGNSTNYTSEQWQNNGSVTYYPIAVTAAGDFQITTSTHANAGNFAAGDYIAIFESTATGATIMADIAKVLSANSSTGVVVLSKILDRSFTGSPVAGKVTSYTTHDVTLRNITIIGAQPIIGRDIYTVNFDRVVALTDNTVGGTNLTNILYLNYFRDYKIKDSTFGTLLNGAAWVPLELPQDNSGGPGLIENSYLYGETIAMGEHASRVKFKNNHYNIRPQSSDATGILLEGQGIEVAGGDMRGGDLTGGSGSGQFFQDISPANISTNSGFIMNDVTIVAKATGETCVNGSGNDSMFIHNNITCIGGQGLFIGNSGTAQAVIASDNTITGAGLNLVLSTTTNDQSVISNNVVNVTGGSGYGIYVYDSASAQGGVGHKITGNIVNGTATPTFMTLAKHPKSVIDTGRNNANLIIAGTSTYTTPCTSAGYPGDLIVLNVASTTATLTTPCNSGAIGANIAISNVSTNAATINAGSGIFYGSGLANPSSLTLPAGQWAEFTWDTVNWHVALSGTPGSATWGAITGTLSSQTDLQTALNGKAPSSGIALSALASQAADTVVMNAGGSSSVPAAVALVSCSGANSALTYNTSTHSWGCNTISGSGSWTTTTVAGLGSATAGAPKGVTDAANWNDCSVGGGAFKVICWPDGTTWRAIPISPGPGTNSDMVWDFTQTPPTLVPSYSVMATLATTQHFTGLKTIDQMAMTPITVATLGGMSASSHANQVYVVSDGVSACDLTTGGGSYSVVARSNGTAWVAPNCGGGSGGSAPVPYTVNASTSPQTITATAHGQGTNPIVQCWSGALSSGVTTGVSVPCAASKSGTAGDIIVTYTSGDVGSIEVLAAGPGPAGSGGSMTWPAAAGIAVYAGSSAWGTSLTAPSGAIVGTTDTQTLTNKTVDGVTPSTMAFLDATSSIQTQLNGKQATITTGTVDQLLNGTLTLTSLVNCVSTGGVLQYSTTSHALACHTLAAGDIPTLNQNTTGTAANLSGTPALPNGTTATTQSAGDNSTKLATTAYVDTKTTALTSLATQANATMVANTSGATAAPTAVAIPTSTHVLATGGNGALTAATAGDLAAIVYVAGGGTAQAQTATYAPALGSLTDGLRVCWKPSAANTAAAPTFAPNGLTAHTIVKVPNATALVANDLITTQIACAIYDSTGTQWELQNPATATTGGSISGLTTGAFPKASSSTTVANSNLSENSDGSDNAAKALTWAAAYKPTFGSGSTTTGDLSQSNLIEVDFGAGNTTLAFTNPHGSGPYWLRSCQDSVGGRTYTFAGTMKGFSQPDPAAGTTNCTEQSFTYDGTNYQAGPAVTPTSAWHGLTATEGTAPTGVTGADILYADSTAHRLKMTNNAGTAVQVVGSGGDITTSDTIAANAVNSSKMAVVNTRRTCIIDNDTQSSTALTAAQISGGCDVPFAATIVEVDVWGGTGTTGGTLTTTGTSSINLQKYTPSGGATSTLLSGNLATASGQACALTSTSGTCINGTTSSSSITISTTSLSAGDWIRISAASVDSTQTWYRVAVIYTVN